MNRIELRNPLMNPGGRLKRMVGWEREVGYIEVIGNGSVLLGVVTGGATLVS
jgi:hypothetical protein